MRGNKILLLVLFLFFPLHAKDPGPYPYKVTHKEGDVKVLRDGKSINVFQGDFLYFGDTVQTPLNGLLILAFGDDLKGALKIGKTSHVAIGGRLKGIDRITSSRYELLEEMAYQNLIKSNLAARPAIDLLFGSVVVVDPYSLIERSSPLILAGGNKISGPLSEYFVYQDEKSVGTDYKTLVAVKDGRVSFIRAERPLTLLGAREGVIETPIGNSGIDFDPTWYTSISWAFAGERKDFFHHFKFSEIPFNNLKYPYLERGNALSAQGKKWGEECQKGKGDSCFELGKEYIQKGVLGDNPRSVVDLFKKAEKDDIIIAEAYRLFLQAEFSPLKEQPQVSKELKESCAKEYFYPCLYLVYDNLIKGKNEGFNDYFKKASHLFKDAKDKEALISLNRNLCEWGYAKSCYKIGDFLFKNDEQKRGMRFLQEACHLGVGSACHRYGSFLLTLDKKERASEYFQSSCHLLSREGCYLYLLEEGQKLEGAKEMVLSDRQKERFQKTYDLLIQLQFKNWDKLKSMKAFKALKEKASLRYFQ